MLQSVITNKKGQGLLELLVALTVLVIALTATLSLIVTSINAGRDSKNKLIATHLAREGIEVVRNIRDSNWIDITDPEPMWDDGLVDDGTATLNVLPNTPLDLSFVADDFNHSDVVIKLSGNSYEQGAASSGTPIQFYRLIYINDICIDDSGPPSEQIIPVGSSNNCPTEFGGSYSKVGMQVMSEVRWSDSSSNKNVILEERLYNWQVL